MEVFNVLNDCEGTNLKLTFAISTENIECVFECLHNENYKFQKDMRSCIELLFFVSYLGTDEELCGRVYNKMNKLNFTIDEFINIGGDYAHSKEI